MGTFRQQIEVGDFEGSRFEVLGALVHTGVTYTSVPTNVLARARYYTGGGASIHLANGQRTTLGFAWIRLRLEGKEQPTLVIFGEPGSQPLLGAFALEGFGLAADPVNHRLVPAPGYLVGVLEADT
jgi:predicted aspartyl protease